MIKKSLTKRRDVTPFSFVHGLFSPVAGKGPGLLTCGRAGGEKKKKKKKKKKKERGGERRKGSYAGFIWVSV